MAHVWVIEEAWYKKKFKPGEHGLYYFDEDDAKECVKLSNRPLGMCVKYRAVKYIRED